MVCCQRLMCIIFLKIHGYLNYQELKQEQLSDSIITLLNFNNLVSYLYHVIYDRFYEVSEHSFLFTVSNCSQLLKYPHHLEGYQSNGESNVGSF